MSTVASLSPKRLLKRSLSSAHTCKSWERGRGCIFDSTFGFHGCEGLGTAWSSCRMERVCEHWLSFYFRPRCRLMKWKMCLVGQGMFLLCISCGDEQMRSVVWFAAGHLQPCDTETGQERHIPCNLYHTAHCFAVFSSLNLVANTSADLSNGQN